MAIKLGQIVIEMLAETAKFLDGMNKASYASKKTAKEIQQNFAEMGHAAEGLLAPFGEVGAALGSAFGNLGSTFSAVTNGFKSIAGGAGEAAIAVGGLVAGIAALGAVGGGIAVFAAHAANEMFELSEKTGVSVESLSRLSYGAGVTGVSTEALAKGLEKMAKSAFAASVAPEGARNAYTRLGVSVKDANGELKPAGQLFEEVSDKLANMGDKTARVALAQQIFSRSGAELLPYLLKGKAGIAALSAEADQLGITLSTKTAAQSHEFEETLKRMQGALKGAANSVLIELLPALQGIASFMLDEFKDPSSSLRLIGGTVMEIVVPAFKLLAAGIGIVVTFADYLTTTLSHGLTFISKLVLGVADALSKLGKADFKGAAQSIGTAFKSGLKEMDEGINKDVATANDKLASLFGKLLFSPDDSDQAKKPEGKDKVDNKTADKRNLVNDRIAHIAAEVAKNAELAASFTGLKEQTLAATAAAEANQIINDLNIQGAQKSVKVNETQADAIRKLTLMVDAFKEALTVNKELDASIQKTEQSTRAASLMAAAYLEGADAVEKAKEQIELLPLQKQVADLAAVYKQLSTTDGGFGSLTQVLKNMGPAGAELQKQFKALGIENLSGLRSALADATTKLDILKTDKPLEVQAKTAEEANKKIGELKQTTEAHLRALTQENAAILEGSKALQDYAIAQQLEKLFPKDIDKQSEAYRNLKAELELLATEEKTRTQNLERQKLDDITRANIAALRDENAAILEGGTAIKNFNLYKELAKAFPSDTDKETEAYKKQKDALDELNQLQLEHAAVLKVNTLLKFNDLEKELEYLQTLRDSTNLSYDQQVAIDATIHDDKLKQIQDYDNLLLKSNSVGDGFTAFFTNMANEGKTAAQQVYDALNTAFTGIDDNLAKFFTGQKTNWTALGKTIEDTLAKTLIGNVQKSLTSSLLGSLGLGAAIKRDGSSKQSALFVEMASPLGAAAGLSSPFGASGLDNLPLGLGNLFGNSSGTTTAATSTGTGGGIGGFFGTLLGLLPHFEGGGDVQPGGAYVVGEKRPELFMPRSAGTIVPSVPGSHATVHQTTVQMHITGVTDADSFKKSSAQISNGMGNALQRAQVRTR